VSEKLSKLDASEQNEQSRDEVKTDVASVDGPVVSSENSDVKNDKTLLGIYRCYTDNCYLLMLLLMCSLVA